MASNIIKFVGGRVDKSKTGGCLFDCTEVYDLPSVDLSAYKGMVVASSCDQRFLQTQQEKLGAWVKAGGKMLVNGHPVLPFLPCMPKHRQLIFHGVDDLWLSAVGEHPIWEGVDREEFILRTGVPGEHSLEDLVENCGVAGFYARSYLVDLPKIHTVITGIGANALPCDVSFPCGDGEVIMHCGIDLENFNPDLLAGKYDMRARVVEYLGGE